MEGEKKKESKVSVIINAGLGNQLFQVAFIYAFGKRNNKPYGIYNIIHDNPHSTKDYHQLVYPSINQIQMEPNAQLMMEDHPLLFKNFEPRDYDCVYKGCFQSEQYFHEYRNDLIQLFRFPKLPIKFKKNSYFIHVRRGDYVSPHLINYHYVPLDIYYMKSIEYLKKVKKDLKIYIVSNDVPYCKKLFKHIENTIFINDNGKNLLDELETMTLMKSCEYGGICSNSTFSWWGAYLNESPNKICMFPNKWFPNNSSAVLDHYDIYFKGCYIMDLDSFEVKKYQ